MPLPVPPDLEAALAQAPRARARFDALPSEGKDAWIAWVQRARLGPSRRRRIGTAVARLGGEPVAREQVVEELPPGPLWWPWLLALALALLIAALLVWLLVYRDNGNGHRNNVVVQRATVPHVIGQSQASAQKQVQSAGLSPVVSKRQATEAAGTVVDQRPEAGKVVQSGSVVTLVVSKGPSAQAVPGVTGLAAADAVSKLQGAGFSPKLVDVQAKQAAGSVVSQKPAAGAKAKPGSQVVLDVSRGAGKVTVPVVTGETASQAMSDLQAAGLKVSTANVASDQPQGTVVAQDPAGGDRVVKGSPVRLNVSKGAPAATTQVTTTRQQTTTRQATTTQQTTTTRQTTTSATTTQQSPGAIGVPSLIGEGLASALGALERAGLRSTVKYQSSQTPLGQVRGQNPAAGAKVPPRTRVQLNVSEGPNPGNPTQVPDETGQDKSTARSDLQDAGFKVIVIQRSGGGQSGTVLEQQPSAGTSIASDDYVAIYVAP